MSIIHDGAGFSRTEKIAVLANHTEACNVLKVCWEGAVQSSNCGYCEKCIRTQLNFLAAGCNIPLCFPKSFDMRHINSINIRNTAQLAELSSIIHHANANGIVSAWVPVLQKRVRTWRPISRSRRMRAQLINVLIFLGIKEQVKQLWNLRKR
jgi:hypothetical protein